MITLEPIQPIMRETKPEDLKAAVYGIARLVAGWNDWKLVEDIPQENRIAKLSELSTKELLDLQIDIANMDPKKQNQVLRKVRAYQQLLLIEKFCFDEVEW